MMDRMANGLNDRGYRWSVILAVVLLAMFAARSAAQIGQEEYATFNEEDKRLTITDLDGDETLWFALDDSVKVRYVSPKFMEVFRVTCRQYKGGLLYSYFEVNMDREPNAYGLFEYEHVFNIRDNTKINKKDWHYLQVDIESFDAGSRGDRYNYFSTTKATLSNLQVRPVGEWDDWPGNPDDWFTYNAGVLTIHTQVVAPTQFVQNLIEVNGHDKGNFHYAGVDGYGYVYSANVSIPGGAVCMFQLVGHNPRSGGPPGNHFRTNKATLENLRVRPLDEDDMHPGDPEDHFEISPEGVIVAHSKHIAPVNLTRNYVSANDQHIAEFSYVGTDDYGYVWTAQADIPEGAIVELHLDNDNAGDKEQMAATYLRIDTEETDLPHSLKTYSDSGYSVPALIFPSDATVYIKVFGKGGKLTPNRSKAQLMDYGNEIKRLAPPVDYGYHADGGYYYRFAMDLSDGEKSLESGWWYNLAVTAKKKQGSNLLTRFTGVKQIAIFDPAGVITLYADPPNIEADGVSTSSIYSDPIRDVNDNVAPDGTLVTIQSGAGTIVAEDVDENIPGIQLATEDGMISFYLRAETEPDTALVEADTVIGDAHGETSVGFSSGGESSPVPDVESFAASSGEVEQVTLTWTNPGNTLVGGTDGTGFTTEVLSAEEDGGLTTWEFRVTSDGDSHTPALSHIDFELPESEQELAQSTAYCSRGWSTEIGVDPTTGINGIKFDDAELGEDGQIESVILRFTVTTGSVHFMTVATKAGRRISSTTVGYGFEYHHTMIRYRTDEVYPADIQDGELVCSEEGEPGEEDSYVHTGLTSGQTYYYTAFVFSIEQNNSDGVNAAGTPCGLNLHFDIETALQGIAGIPHQIRIIPKDGEGDVYTGYTGEKTVTLTSTHVNPDTGSYTIDSHGQPLALTFPAQAPYGATVDITYRDAGQITVTAEEQDVVGTSSNIQFRPYEFVVVPPTGYDRLIIRQPFQPTIRALAATGNTTPNYRGTVTLTPIYVYPVTSDGVFSPTSLSEFADGEAVGGETSPSLIYDRWGTCWLKAEDSLNGDLSGISDEILHFVPQQFAVTVFDSQGNLKDTQDSLVYKNEPFSVCISPLDAEGGIVTNYVQSVSVSADAGSVNGLPGSFPFTSGEQGVKTISGLTALQSANMTISAVDADNVSGTSPACNVVYGKMVVRSAEGRVGKIVHVGVEIIDGDSPDENVVTLDSRSEFTITIDGDTTVPPSAWSDALGSSRKVSSGVRQIQVRHTKAEILTLTPVPPAYIEPVAGFVTFSGVDLKGIRFWEEKN